MPARPVGRTTFLVSRRRRRTAVTAVTVALALTVATPATAGGAEPETQHVPRRAVLKAVPVKTGLAGPSGFTFGPNGRIWYLERATGRVRVLDPGTKNERTFFRITNVRAEGERGALGIALHPRYPRKPFVYAYATRMQSGRLWNQVLRIRADGGKGVGFKVLLRTPVGAATNHNGGRILIGPDRKLWIFDGDNANPANAQDRTKNWMGKILRLELNGSVPATNPFGNPIWSFGHRNSFGFTFDPRTGRLWQTENGPSCNDEINLIVRGGNFAWGPNWRCPASPTVQDTNRDGPSPRLLPKRRFVTPIGITGAAFCERCGLGGPRNGDLLFGAVNDQRIRSLEMNQARTGFSSSVRVLGSVPIRVHSMEVGADRRIYISGSTGIYRLVRS
jgi:glucose/arabinose dehydrogenase